jgi:hypothetical protein
MPVRLKQGPGVLALFRENFISGKIHDWQMCEMDSLLNEAENVNKYLVCSLEEGGIEHFVNVYLIASCWTNTSDHLAIDLNPERFGWIINVWYNPNLAEGDYPVVAHSFTEWLERTLDAGPGIACYDAGPGKACYYWASPDFVDMGPAIPGDPHYKPRNKCEE